MKASSVSLDDELLQEISQGCDERTLIQGDSGRNKYHLSPLKSSGLFYRGSCTAGALTTETTGVALEGLGRMQTEAPGDAWAEEQRSRLKALIPTPTPFEVFFAPSGTDLIYLPLLFARLQSDRPLLNLLSCPEELGSGSHLAAEGKFFASRSATGQNTPKGELLHPDLAGETIELAARTAEGHIRNRNQEIRDLLDAHQDKWIIAHLVFGSKSGIKDDLQVIEKRANVFWTVDLCQFRADPVLIGQLLAQGAMVLITGSKFYQAPPFCGALLVPQELSQPLHAAQSSAAEGLASIFVRSDLPPHFAGLRKSLTQAENFGSRLRWDCALWEMEAMRAFSRKAIDQCIANWNRKVSEALESYPEFSLIPDQKLTNDSIISFRVKRQGRYLDLAELKQLFRVFVTTDWSAEGPYDQIFIGQPVSYGSRSFIRFALGSHAVRQALTQGEDWSYDALMVKLLAQTSRTIFPEA